MIGQDLILENKPSKQLADFMPFFWVFALEVPEFKKLVADATKDGPIKIRFVSPNKAPYGASWDVDDRTIFLSFELDALNVIDSLVFELCNANNHSINSELLTPERFQSADEYAWAMEHSEYEYTCKPAQEISGKLYFNNQIKSLLSKYEFNTYDITMHIAEFNFNSFEIYLDSNEDHTDSYRDEWHQQMQESQTGYLPRGFRNENYLEFFNLVAIFPESSVGIRQDL